MLWCWVAYSWLSARLDTLVRVRLLSFAYAFTDDMMHLTRLQVYFNYPTVLSIIVPESATTAPFTEINSPLHIRPFASGHRRSP